jgi:hypothetical protein
MAGVDRSSTFYILRHVTVPSRTVRAIANNQRSVNISQPYQARRVA